MLRNLSLLAAGCLLLDSCTKHDANPAASLEGNWVVQSRTDYYNPPSNDPTQITGPIPMVGKYRLVITADSMVGFETYAAGEFRSFVYAYTRQGMTLTNSRTNEKIEIKELSAHTLTVFFKGPGTSWNYDYAYAR